MHLKIGIILLVSWRNLKKGRAFQEVEHKKVPEVPKVENEPNKLNEPNEPNKT